MGFYDTGNCETAISACWRRWSIIVVGGLIIIAAFCWDYRNVMAGSMPNPFQWSIFVTAKPWA